MIKNIFFAAAALYAVPLLNATVANNLAGSVTYQNGDPMSGVTVTIYANGVPVQSNVSNTTGAFHFKDIPNGNYTIIPTRVGCVAFTPASRDLTITTNLSNITFVGQCVVADITLVSPTNTATGIPPTPTLSWHSDGATMFEVYFGTSSTPSYLADSVNFSYTFPAPLQFGATYYWFVRASNDHVNWVTSPTWSFTTTTTLPPAGAGLQFVPVTPCRIADTRADRAMTGPFGPPAMGTNTTRTFPIPAGSCNVPVTAKAYSLNVTALPLAGKLGYLTVWPTGAPKPRTSVINSDDGTVVANSAIIPAGTAGSVDVYAPDATEIIIDVNGYFTDQAGSAALSFFPLIPCRMADTRKSDMPTGFGSPSLSPNVSRAFPIPTSGCAVPLASAYTLNLTAVPLSGFLGYLTAYPTSASVPVVSTLNSFDGRVVANQAIVPAAADGSVSLFTADPTNVIIDVNGYFSALTGGLSFYPLTPCRILDSRAGSPLLAGTTTDILVAPVTSCGVPATAKAVAVNLTALPVGGPLGYLLAWPSGVAKPLASSLNSSKGLTVANGALVQLGANGAMSVFASDTTNLIVDLAGYFQ